MKIHNVAQGTQEWMALRAGRPTASCFDSILTPGGKKNEPKRSAGWERYMNHLLAERIIGQPIDGFTSKWMERGSEMEHRAIASYELANDCETERIGFVTLDDGAAGASPDRFIVGNSVGMVEAKAPAVAAIHIAYLRASAGASDEYKVQLQGQLWVCEREWVDIISFYPDIRDAQFRVTRDDLFIKELEAHVRSFCRQLDEITEEFRERGWMEEPPTGEVDPSFDPFGITDDDVKAVWDSRLNKDEVPGDWRVANGEAKA